MKTLLTRLLTVLTSLSLLTAAVLAPAQAAMVSSQQLLGAPSRDADLLAVQAYLERDQVRAQLEHWGVAADQAAERVAALDDAELRQLASTIDEQPAGGILGLIGAVFVVLLILELTGVINIFTRI